MRFVILAFLSGCAGLYGKEMQIEDCVTRHLKVLVRKEGLNLTTEFYENVTDNCKQIYNGRP